MIPDKILIRELGPREGFQTLDKIVPTEQKLELIEALSETGVQEIEVASFVRPDKVPQMADAEAVIAGLSPRKGLIFKGLYLNRRGYERAVASKLLSKQGWINIAASETFLQKNANTSSGQVINEIPIWVEGFKQAGESLHGLMLSTAFGCNYEGEVPTAKVLSVLSGVYDAAVASNALLKEVCLADTMGWGTPQRVHELVDLVRKKYPDISISLHFHDTRGTGMANVYAGLECGIKIFESSLGGLGGCPFAKGAAGNVCTEDVAFMCEEMGIDTGLDLRKYASAAILAEKIVGISLPGKFYKSAQRVDMVSLRKH